MDDESKKIEGSFDPKVRFSVALENLENFTQEHQQTSPLIKIARFAKSWMFNEMTTTPQEEGSVHLAIDELERFHAIVFQADNEETRRLHLKTINICKILCETNNSAHIKQRLKRLIDKKSFTETLSDDEAFKPEEQKKPVTGKISDVFRMKAITLMKEHAELFPSHHPFYALREVPVLQVFSSEETKEDKNCFILEQKISPFPGETLIVRGSFNQGLPQNFSLLRESMQTGFPYPVQHNGWALASPLLPFFPMRSELIEQLSSLLEKKELVKDAFLNKTSLFHQAQALSKQKSELIEKNDQEFLTLHKELAESCLKAIPEELYHPNAAATLTHFFTWLNTRPFPFKELSNLYKHLNQCYIVQPHQHLMHAWQHQLSRKLFHKNPLRRKEEAAQILYHQLAIAPLLSRDLENRPEASSYLALMGGILGQASIPIILQYFSETLQFAPPKLNSFEKTVQSIALFQLETFFSDLKEPSSASFINSLKHEIALFQSKALQHPLCDQIERYYNDRTLNE